MGLVLLVDQEFDLLREWSWQLRRRGQESIAASSLQEALALLSANRNTIEQVVVGGQLADGRAVDLVEAIGGLPLDPTTTALVDRYSADVVIDLLQWFDFVIPKPLSADQLHNLCVAIRRPRVQRQLIECCVAFSRRYSLSPKETALLSMALRRMNNDEAADLLGCARTTVTTYWNRIFNKTNCRSQRDVIAAVLSDEIERRQRRSGVIQVAPVSSAQVVSVKNVRVLNKRT